MSGALISECPQLLFGDAEGEPVDYITRLHRGTRRRQTYESLSEEQEPLGGRIYRNDTEWNLQMHNN
jgi:hypothetical protein